MTNAQLEQAIVSLIQTDAAITMPFHAFSANPSIVKKIDQGLGIVLYRGSDNDDASGVNYVMVKKNLKCALLFYAYDIELIHATLERCYSILLGKQPSPDHDPIIVLSDSVDLQDSGLFEGMMLVETSVYVTAG
jgi:hypothetical protein